MKGDEVVLIGATIGRYHKGWTVRTDSVKVVHVVKKGLVYECLHTKEGVHSFRLFGVENPLALQINPIQNPELNVAVRRALMNLSVRGICRLLGKLQEDVVVSEGRIRYDLYVTGKGYDADSNVMFERIKCFFRRIAEGKVPNYSLD